MRKYILATSLALALTGMSFVVTNDRLFEISKNIEIFINIFKELNANYVDQIDPSKLMRTGIDAMVGSLDPFTNYISESQVESYRINDDAKYRGIGATVEIVDGELTIYEAYEGSALLKAGVFPGDKILKINGNPTKGKAIEEANQILRGVDGTSVELEVQSIDGKTKTVSIERADVKLGNVPYYGFVEDGIGYIALTTFTADAGKHIAKGLKELKKENPSISGLVLDLRNNGGGLLREAISICNIFVPKDQVVVTTKGKLPENDNTFKTTDIPLDLDIPITVLINKKSASASEIVSGVIQDLDRGVVVGQRSYGKGLVQNTKEIGYNSRVKLTTSKYYIPSGRCIQSVEYENGEPKDIPDAARSMFKTQSGRTVLDGGGVTPDVKLPAPIVPDIVAKLNENHIIFKFVNSIVASTKDTLDLKDIKFEDFNSFKAFVGNQNFKYISESRNKLDKYEKEIENEELYGNIGPELKILRDKIMKEESTAMDSNKNAILIEINKDLASRYYFEKGRIYSTLDQDSEIKECIKLLRDEAKYKSILQ